MTPSIEERVPLSSRQQLRFAMITTVGGRACSRRIIPIASEMRGEAASAARRPLPERVNKRRARPRHNLVQSEGVLPGHRNLTTSQPQSGGFLQAGGLSESGVDCGG